MYRKWVILGILLSNLLGCAQNSSTPTPNPNNPSGNLMAFPGAEGFGAIATGGRGGKVIYVTNLNTSGEGSLQWALDQTGPRTIVFKVGGLIPGLVSLHNGDVTIAGQTAPGGITVQSLLIEGDIVCEDDRDACVPKVAPQNFIVRFMRSRLPGDNTGGDTLRLHRAKKGILDHISVGNASDEAIQISFTSDVTIQKSMLAETLGGHADLGGMLMNYSDPTRGYPLDRLSIIKNTFNRINGRIPEISRENYPSAKGTFLNLEFSYNLIFDPKAAIWVAMNCNPGTDNGYANCPLYYNINMVGNYIFGSSARFNYGLISLEGGLLPSEGYLPSSSPTRFFMNENRINRFPGVRDYQLIYCCNDMDQAVKDNGMPYPDLSRPPQFSQATRHDFPAVSAIATGNALLEFMSKNAGDFPRDPMDTRLMSFVAKGEIDPSPTDTNPANDALKILPASAAPADTDSDGMPDAWEVLHNLDPNKPNNNGLELGNLTSNGIAGCTAGYTNLECYLNELADKLVNQ